MRLKMIDSGLAHSFIAEALNNFISIWNHAESPSILIVLGKRAAVFEKRANIDLVIDAPQRID